MIFYVWPIYGQSEKNKFALVNLDSWTRCDNDERTQSNCEEKDETKQQTISL